MLGTGLMLSSERRQKTSCGAHGGNGRRASREERRAAASRVVRYGNPGPGEAASIKIHIINRITEIY